MELRYLLKQLMVLKFLTEGGREVQIDDPERERERQEKETWTQMHVFSKCHNILSMHRVWKIVRRSAKVTELHHTYP